MRWLAICAAAVFFPLAVRGEDGKKAAAKDGAKAGQDKLAELEAREKEKEKTALKGCKALMIIAPENFRDEELNIPKKIFEDHGATVEVASTSRHECRGMRGSSVYPDIELTKVNLDDYLIVVLVGGIGVKTFFADKALHLFLREAAGGGRILGAICLAPLVLAKADLLNGKKATVWDDAQKNSSRVLKERGATYINEAVVVDANLVTANGPEAAEAFAHKIVELAKSAKKKIGQKKAAQVGDEDKANK